LIARALELWVHENDIRAAVALPPSVPDAATLSLMTDAAANMLPVAAAQASLADDVDVHLVLTGPGGGTWDIAVGPSTSARTPVTIVTDAVGFCRLAANRITVAGLDPYVTGDQGRATAVLAAASTLAMD
jgi:hypothetical protein